MHGIGSAGRGSWAVGRMIDARYVSRETPHFLETLAWTTGADLAAAEESARASGSPPGSGQFLGGRFIEGVSAARGPAGRSAYAPKTIQALLPRTTKSVK